MDASVTLKLSPAEFDLLREAVRWMQSNQEQVARDSDTDSPIRREARQDAVRLSDLLSKMQ